MSSTNTTRIIVPSPTVTEEPSQLPIQQPAVSVAAEPSIWSSPQSDTCVIPADLDASAMVQSPEELFGVLPLSNQGAVPGAGGAGNEEEIAAMSSNMESVHTEHVLDSHPVDVVRNRITNQHADRTLLGTFSVGASGNTPFRLQLLMRVQWLGYCAGRNA
ncbi:hypothetical protein V6N11_029091 [Hibiscus sabdariffa]|uniref:Uncharacterized protein n=1 Tax=Hibiscus sabdariffa TaxID=183260 RepID=A0ABR1ZRS8_9ROSI